MHAFSLMRGNSGAVEFNFRFVFYDLFISNKPPPPGWAV